MLPALLVIVLVMAFPLAYLLFMSVHKWSMVGYEPPSFVGSSNFVALINDQRFIASLARTLYFTALGLVSNIPVGFAIALLLAENFPTRNLLRALLILPMVATPVAMGLVWVVMLDPSLGIVRYLLGLVGLDSPPLWLSDTAWVVPTLVAVDAWMWTPMVALICIAGLAALPADFRRKHETAIAIGHCNLLPADALPARARAQMARDIVMARSIRPYIERGVVLLAGNGHVRRDIGVAFWLPADERRSLVSIGLLERDDNAAGTESPVEFDYYAITERAERVDPCKDLAQRLQRGTER